MALKRVYLDWAAAAPLIPEVERALVKTLKLFGNPSAPHTEGRAARAALDQARSDIARALGVKSEELIFTSGGTEANALAILGLIGALRAGGRAYSDMQCITTSIEHASVIHTMGMLERDGVHVTYVDPKANGIVDADTILKTVTPKTILLSLALVNSEIGTIQPVRDIGVALRKKGVGRPILHVDAAQAPLYLDSSPHTLRADLVTYDAQKISGPKGVGLLYRDFAVPLAPIYGGGSQERHLRPGTENVLAICAAAPAFVAAAKNRKKRAISVTKLRDYLIKKIEAAVPNVSITGSRRLRVANNVHITVPGADGDYLAVLMDKEGIAVSPRSACVGSGGDYSHVVYVLTGDRDLARQTLRFTLGPTTTKRDIDRAIKALVKVLLIAKRGIR